MTAHFQRKKALNLFKSQGYLSPEEVKQAKQEVWTRYRSGYLTDLSIALEKAKKQFKSQVEGLTVIGTPSMTPVLNRITLPHNIPATAENYDYLWAERKALVEAQLEHTISGSIFDSH